MSQASPDTSSKSALLAWIKDPARRPAELTAATGFFPEADRAITARVDCPPEVLATLSHSSDKATRAKVTANPNTPAADYVRLGQQFPKEFIANPLLDLLLLENPALLDEVPTALLVQIAKKPECPAAFLIWTASHADEKVQLAVAMNAKAPDEALARLRESAFAKVRESVSAAGAAVEGDPEVLFRGAVRERLAGLTPEEAAEAWKRGDIGFAQFAALSLDARLLVAALVGAERRMALVINAAFPEELRTALRGVNLHQKAQLKALESRLEALATDAEIWAQAKDKDYLQRWIAARNALAPAALLEALANDKHEWVRRSVGENPNTPVAVLETLARDEDETVRSEVAGNPSTAVALLYALVEDTHERVRASVAENPNTPVAMLCALAEDPHERVRGSVARNPNTPVTVLCTLAEDIDERVQSPVAYNPNTPVAVLEALARATHEQVRRSVAANPRTPSATLVMLAKDESGDVRRSVACNPNTPTVLLEVLAKDENENVRRSVANNPNTPVAALEVLAQDEKKDVRSLVAENPNTPTSVSEALAIAQFVMLAKDQNHDVRYSVAKNPSAPAAILEALAQDQEMMVRSCIADNPNTPAKVLVALANDKNSNVRRAIARNPNAPLAVLEALARDEDDHVRFTIADNPNLPATVLAHTLDQNDRVRIRAACNPSLPTALSAPLLEELAQANDEWVRRSVAENSNTPDAALEILSSDKNGDVCEAVARNAKTGLALLERLSSGRTSVRVRVALHPNASPDLLAKMSSDDSESVRAAVAQRRYTPVSVLEALTQDSSYLVECAALANPETPLSLLEDAARAELDWCAGELTAVSDVAARFDCETAQAAVHRGDFLYFHGEDADKTLLSRRPLGMMLAACVSLPLDPVRVAKASASDDWLVRASVARNARTPSNIRKKLQSDANPLVRALASADVENRSTGDDVHPKAAVDYERIRTALAEGDLNSALCRLAMSPEASPEFLDAISETQIKGIRRAVSSNRRTPAKTLGLLAKDKDLLVRLNVAEVRGEPNESVMGLLTRMARDKSAVYRREAAENLKTPVEILHRLAIDEDSYVRSSVAGNSNTPVVVLEVLAKDANPSVRARVTGNPNTPVEVLDVLANGYGADVLCSLVGNPNTPIEKIEQALARESSGSGYHSVLAPAARRLLGSKAADPSSPYQKEWYERFCRSLASNPTCPDGMLQSLSKDKSANVRAGVAINPACPIAMLERLARDKDVGVRAAIATNPRVPDHLRLLLQAERSQCQQRLEHESLVLLGIEQLRDESLPLSSVLYWIESGTDFPADPDKKALGKLMKKKQWLIRLGVALHPSATGAMLKKLSEDSDKDVAAAAMARLV